MTIYVTRHGQPALEGLSPGLDHESPPGDPALMDLGIEQARLLGAYLRSRSFTGKIYASPYRRTLYTAAEVAQATGTCIYPEKAIQEYVPFPGTPEFPALRLPEMAALFDAVSPDAVLDDPWLFSGPESTEEVERRVAPFLERLMHSGEREVLLVGHGASVGACKRLLFRAGNLPCEARHNWNCSLSAFVVEEGRTTEVALNCDVSFMPLQLVTSNLLTYEEYEREERRRKAEE